MKKINIVLIVLFLMCLFACGKVSNGKDIVILYTTDVHCGIDENIGYAGIFNYSVKMKKDNYVTLVDAGDALSGDFYGSVDKGKTIIGLMNSARYDLFVFGNHEFDYGMDELASRCNEFRGDVLSCNFTYTGSGENKFENVKTYKVIDYDGTKVGYVGVTAPSTIIESTPSYFMEDGEYAYSFLYNSSSDFYASIQNAVDSCYSEGASYVVLIAHLGSEEHLTPFSSRDVIRNVSGLSVVLDGHSHLTLDTSVKDKDGKDVKLLDAGYKLNSFGKVTIHKGELKAELISDYTEKSQDFAGEIERCKAEVDVQANQVLANIDISLNVHDEYNVRMIRSREMPLGDLIADAYRYFGQADIGIINGGGIRTNLKAGNVTYKDIMAVHPFGNTLCVVKAKGAQILDYLEFVYRSTQSEYWEQDSVRLPIGENGGFAQVSGITLVIDTSIASSVVIDENGVFAGVEGERRVKNVKVIEDGKYVDIDPEKTYTVASINYILIEGGDGANMFKGSEVVKKDIMRDYEVVIKYIVEVLEGNLGAKYTYSQNRIVVK